MPNTPNYNLSVYPSSDVTTKFITYRTDTAGTQESSNFMVIDSVLKRVETQANAAPLQVSATGTNTYTSTIEGFTYIKGQSIVLSVNNTNTGSSTLNINSLGARPIMKYQADGTLVQISAGDLRKGNLYLFANQGSNWVMVGVSNGAQINIAGSENDIVGIGSNNTLESTGISISDVEMKVNTSYTAGESIGLNQVVGLGTDNKWHVVTTGKSFPIGTLYGVAKEAGTANNIVPVYLTGNVSPSFTGYTGTRTAGNKLFVKGTIEDGEFTSTNVITTTMEADASYLAIGYYVSDTSTKLDAVHTVYTLNVDGNVNAIDGVPLGGASGGSGTTQVFSIGDGTKTEFVLNHGYNTTLVQLLVRTTATPQTYLVPDWQIVDNNNVKLIFDSAPTANQYQAIVFVFNPSTKVTKYEETLTESKTEYYIPHNLGVSYPTVKLIQLTDEALVFPHIEYVDDTDSPSQNVLKLGFYSAPTANSLKVIVESDVVQTEGASMLGGHAPNYYLPETVTNSNGTAIKFSDGTMICTKVVPWSTAINSQLGSIYYTPTPQSTGNFAVPFIEKPVVQITVCASGGTAAWYWVPTEPTTTTGPGVGLIRPSSAEAKDYVYNINLVAIGRWK